MIGTNADGRLEGRGDSCVGAAVDGDRVGDLDIGAIDDGIALSVTLGVDVGTSDGDDGDDDCDDGLELRLALGVTLGVDVGTSDGDDCDDGLGLGTVDDSIGVDDEGARDTAVTGDTDGDCCVGAAVDGNRVGDLDIGAIDNGNVVVGALEGAREGALLGAGEGCTFVGSCVG